jgi:flagella basal body P-ring formation protein FlgA
MISVSILTMPSSWANVSAKDVSYGVETFVKSAHLAKLQQQYPRGRFSVSINRVDPRLQLADCSIPVQHAFHGAGKDYGHLTVRVRCADETPWTIYVGVTVDIYTPVVVTTQPLKRGQVIEPHMVALQQMSLNGLGPFFYQDLNEVMGKQVTHSMSGQRVVRSSMLESPLTIKRGDRVIIVAQSDSIAVKMDGTALNNGQKGEQIKVRNNRSKRVIKGRVLGKGEVAVLL